MCRPCRRMAGRSARTRCRASRRAPRSAPNLMQRKARKSTGLRRLVTCLVEPRQVRWLRRLAGGDEGKLGDAPRHRYRSGPKKAPGASAPGCRECGAEAAGPRTGIADRCRHAQSRNGAGVGSPRRRERRRSDRAGTGGPRAPGGLPCQAPEKQPEEAPPLRPSPLAAIFRPAPLPAPPSPPQAGRGGVEKKLGGTGESAPTRHGPGPDPRSVGQWITERPVRLCPYAGAAAYACCRPPAAHTGRQSRTGQRAALYGPGNPGQARRVGSQPGPPRPCPGRFSWPGRRSRAWGAALASARANV